MGFISNAIQETIHSAVTHALDDLVSGYSNRRFRLRLWDGATWGTDEDPAFTLVVNHPRALREMFMAPTELTLGEAYISGDLDVEGDMEAAYAFGEYLLAQNKNLSPSRKLKIASMLQGLSLHHSGNGEPKGAEVRGVLHSKERDAQAIRYHYDLPPEFFALWLDRRMVYSCAYFASGPYQSLDEAQDHKLDYICRKLRLRRGDHLLDIGCGWGGLLTYAATHYGVLARGITLSVRQAEVVREKIDRGGLEGRCRVEVCDYRDLEYAQQFDKIASVGMFEHVGEPLLPEYFQHAWRLLRPGGVFLNHGIAASTGHHGNGSSFIERYVFPDGELIPLHRSMGIAEQSGFEVRDVESLREHYVLTLRQWIQRLEARQDEARCIAGEAIYRIWRLYMAGSAHQFRTGELNLYQMLLAKPLNGNSGLPLTRADWYCAPPSSIGKQKAPQG
jgi:cyclopropane-fatty-acyl-phospholipid synthase